MTIFKFSGVSEGQFFIYFAFRCFVMFYYSVSEPKISIQTLTFQTYEITSLSYLHSYDYFSYSRHKNITLSTLECEPLHSKGKWSQGEVVVQKESSESEKMCKSQLSKLLPSCKADCNWKKLSLLFPGGGYRYFRPYDWEGTDFCQMLNSQGHCWNC